MDVKKQIRSVIGTGTAALHCQVSYETVKNWIRKGKLPAYETPGGQHRIHIEDFQHFLESYGMPPFESGHSEKRKVLVVDDESDLVNAIMDYFTEYSNYICRSASDGRRIEVFKPDLIVLDLIMPYMNGIEVCQKIKSDPKTQHILILVITGYPEDDNLTTAQACGADDVLIKPFKLKTLYEHVDALFASHVRKHTSHSTHAAEKIPPGRVAI